MTLTVEQVRNAPRGPDNATAEVERLANQWPKEFRLGYRFGFLCKADQPCDGAGYPLGLHTWPLSRRNAWWCGWNRGRCEHSRLKERLR
jgi:hypothetical protein